MIARLRLLVLTWIAWRNEVYEFWRCDRCGLTATVDDNGAGCMTCHSSGRDYRLSRRLRWFEARERVLRRMITLGEVPRPVPEFSGASDIWGQPLIPGTINDPSLYGSSIFRRPDQIPSTTCECDFCKASRQQVMADAQATYLVSHDFTIPPAATIESIKVGCRVHPTT